MPMEYTIIEREFRRLARTPRTVWVQPTVSGVSGPTGVCLFLDGEYYLDRIRAPEIIAELQREGQLPPMLTAYVSHIDSATRWKDSFCNAEFAEYLALELLPWLVAECGVSSEKDNSIVGLSLTGLSASHAALTYPKRFPRVLSQSGSFRWSEGWLPQHVMGKPRSEVVFRLTVGSDETKADVDHGDGLFQAESQLMSNRRMRDALLATGHRVSFHEFPGGHDFASWRADLAESLIVLFGMT
jgi:enterochelin esterase family protein